MKQPRAVFFDLDDTLCNTSVSRFERARLVAQVLVEHSPLLTQEDLIARVLEQMPETGWPRGARPLVQELGLSDTGIGREAIGRWYFEGCEHLIVGFPGGAAAVAGLSSEYDLGVITNGEDSIQRRKLAALGLSEHFRDFVSSGAAGHQKPESEIFQIAMKNLGVEPHDAIFIGDDLRLDIRGAQQAGMKGVWFNPSGHPAPASILPDATISSLTELPGLIERKNLWG